MVAFGSQHAGDGGGDGEHDERGECGGGVARGGQTQRTAGRRRWVRGGIEAVLAASGGTLATGPNILSWWLVLG